MRTLEAKIEQGYVSDAQRFLDEKLVAAGKSSRLLLSCSRLEDAQVYPGFYLHGIRCSVGDDGNLVLSGNTEVLEMFDGGGVGLGKSAVPRIKSLLDGVEGVNASGHDAGIVLTLTMDRAKFTEFLDESESGLSAYEVDAGEEAVVNRLGRMAFEVRNKAAGASGRVEIARREIAAGEMPVLE